jgi:hypothetical protein
MESHERESAAHEQHAHAISDFFEIGMCLGLAVPLASSYLAAPQMTKNALGLPCNRLGSLS